jgi:Lon protease-like protein
MCVVSTVSCLAEIVLCEKIEDGRGLLDGYKVKLRTFWWCREVTEHCFPFRC